MQRPPVLTILLAGLAMSPGIGVVGCAGNTLAGEPSPAPGSSPGDPAASTASVLAKADVWLLPQPKRVVLSAGNLDLARLKEIRYLGPADSEARAGLQAFAARLKGRCGLALSWRDGLPEKDSISLVLMNGAAASAPALSGVAAHDVREAIQRDGYVLRVEADRVTLAAASPAALRWAQQTLLQLGADRTRLPAICLLDWPSLAYRGVQQDISRGQVPTPATLKRLAEVAAEAKLNLLELYLEHVFKFPSHPDIAPPEGLSPQECRELFDHAAAYGVEVHPLFQALGHAEQILNRPQYQQFRVGPAGKAMTTVTWDVRKPEAVAMIGRLVDDLCRAMPGRIFAADITEVDYEGLLASGTTPAGVTELVFQYVLKLRDMVRPHGMRLLVTQGPLDSVGHLSGLGPRLDHLPKDVIIGSYYCAGGPYRPAWKADFPRLRDKQLAFFAQAWIDSHNRLFPWIDHAAEFSDQEVRAGLAHGAVGSTTCDWGDEGHYHLVGQQWYPFLYHGASAWTGGQVDRPYFDRAFTQILYGLPDDSVARAVRRLGAINGLKVKVRNAPGQVAEVDFPLFWEFFADPLADSRIAALPEPASVGRAILEPAAHAIGVLEAALARATRNRDNLEQLRYAARAYFALGRKLLVAAHLRDPQYPRSLLVAELEELISGYEGLEKDFTRLWLAENRENDNFRAFVGRFDQTILPARQKLKELRR